MPIKTMKRQSRTILLLLIPFLIVIFSFSIFIYYSVSNYSENYFFKLLEARAFKVAKEQLDNEEVVDRNVLDKLSFSEKLPHEKDFFIPIDDAIDLTFEAQRIGIPENFLRNVVKNNSDEYVSERYLYKGINYQSKSGKFIVITAAENYFQLNQAENLIQTLLFAIVASILLLLYIALYFSKNIFKPISIITEQVKEISSENLHLRLKDTNRSDELNELASTFNDMLDRIETSFETQNNFISNASHELRTPLTAIIGEADVALSKPRKPEDYIESLYIILHEAEKLDNKTKALLFLAQTGFNGKVQKFDKVRIDQLLWDVKENLESLNAKNKIHLDMELLPENPMKLKVNGNQQLLHLAFSNIISNGCKYSDYDTVVVSIGASDDFVYVVIRDKGIGIPENEIKYIYDPFFRASNTKNYEGYGIGLPLTRNIIRMHNGKMMVTSLENQGTTVQITLPVWQP
ncbi:sensor histidine kinase [Flavobacterium tibetense]|jgi:signal transduction histidine kinase|uniref:histidine kinase n=1 Tax=Flavobacterium tibetense TaxID=2233533 RepID=A0A365P3M6_9FLAO|nr:HAMP domain-containing sensor histidine kinase [Flavobacterium tibetense]RBA28986.1 sensor histidine kinase [Flavobacterium tibetense]